MDLCSDEDESGANHEERIIEFAPIMAKELAKKHNLERGDEMEDLSKPRQELSQMKGTSGMSQSDKEE